MKPTTPELNALLASGQYIVADLYEFTLIDGTVLYFTSGDQDITTGGHTYSAGGDTGPYFSGPDGGRPKIKWKRGLQVDNLVFDVMPKDGELNGVGILAAIQQGRFDGGTLILSRAYMSTYGTVVGVVTLFTGRIAEIVCGRIFARVTVNSFLELLDQNMPRNLYQAPCLNTLFDTSCTVNRASHANNGVITSGSTQIQLNTTSLAQGTGYFDLGSIVFTSGANENIWRTVKTYTYGGTSTISLISPFPVLPDTGDAFTIYPGCDKKQATCNSKFSNLPNFRGMPYVPENSTAI